MKSAVIWTTLTAGELRLLAELQRCLQAERECWAMFGAEEPSRETMRESFLWRERTLLDRLKTEAAMQGET